MVLCSSCWRNMKLNWPRLVSGLVLNLMLVTTRGISSDGNTQWVSYIYIPKLFALKNWLCLYLILNDNLLIIATATSTLVADVVDPEIPSFTSWASGYPRGSSDCVYTWVKVDILENFRFATLSSNN